MVRLEVPKLKFRQKSERTGLSRQAFEQALTSFEKIKFPSLFVMHFGLNNIGLLLCGVFYSIP